MKYFATLRSLLMVLVVVAMAPLVGLSVVKSLYSSGEDLDKATQNLELIASTVARAQERVADSARQLLVSVSRVPSLADGSAKDCASYFRNLQQELGAYVNLGIISSNGRMLCQGAAKGVGQDVSDSVVFQLSKARSRFFASGYTLEPDSQKPTIAFGLPVLDRHQQPAAVVFAVLNLSELGKALTEVTLPTGGSLIVMDRDGMVLAEGAEKSTVIGQRVSSPLLRQAVTSVSTGLVQGPDINGVHKIYAVSQTRSATDSAFFVAVGLTRDQVAQPARRQLALELMTLLLATGLGCLLAWLVGKRAITQRKRAEQALRDSEQRYAALFEQAPVPMWVYDAQTFRFLTVNSAAIRDYGYSTDEFLSMSVFDIRCDPETPRLAHDGASTSGEPQELLQLRRKDGSCLTVRTVFKTIQYAGKAAWFVLPLDVSAQLQAENEVIDYLATLQRAASAAQTIILHLSVDQMMDEVALQARSVIGAHQALVSTCPDADWSTATHVGSFSKKYADEATSGIRDVSPSSQLQAMVGSDVFASTCRSNQAMRLSQSELDLHPGGGADSTRFSGLRPAMRGWLAVPLVGRQGKTIGLLQLSDKLEGEFTLQDEYVATELARLASIAIENALLLEELTQLNAELEQKVTQRTAALARQEALFRTLADQAPQLVWTTDAQGRVTYLNRACFDLAGGNMQDWEGTKWFSTVHPDDLPEIQANWALAKVRRTPYSGIRRLRAKDGSFHTMAYRASPVFDADNKVDFWVGIDADVTAIKAIEDALRLSNQEMETFSYSVSHDLRAPLNTIDGFSRLLSRQLGAQVGEKERHYLSRIQAGVAQMGQLIEDLLSLAHVSRLPLQKEPIDLSAMCQQVIKEWRLRDPEREVAVHIDVGLRTYGDSGLLRIVLENLMGNAWKFTSGVAHATIRVGQHLDAAGHPEFFVNDNGAGFDMTYADKLFRPFQRLHLPAEFPGSGIGLATAERAMARQGGTLRAEAAVGKGATFFFGLPDPVVPE